MSWGSGSNGPESSFQRDGQPQMADIVGSVIKPTFDAGRGWLAGRLSFGWVQHA